MAVIDLSKIEPSELLNTDKLVGYSADKEVKIVDNPLGNDIVRYDSEGNIEIKYGTKLLLTEENGTESVGLWLAKYVLEDGTVYYQLEGGSSSHHTNWNTNNDPTYGNHITVDTPSGKETIAYLSDLGEVEGDFIPIDGDAVKNDSLRVRGEFRVDGNTTLDAGLSVEQGTITIGKNIVPRINGAIGGSSDIGTANLNIRRVYSYQFYQDGSELSTIYAPIEGNVNENNLDSILLEHFKNATFDNVSVQVKGNITEQATGNISITSGSTLSFIAANATLNGSPILTESTSDDRYIINGLNENNVQVQSEVIQFNSISPQGSAALSLASSNVTMSCSNINTVVNGSINLDAQTNVNINPQNGKALYNGSEIATIDHVAENYLSLVNGGNIQGPTHYKDSEIATIKDVEQNNPLLDSVIGSILSGNILSIDIEDTGLQVQIRQKTSSATAGGDARIDIVSVSGSISNVDAYRISTYNGVSEGSTLSDVTITTTGSVLDDTVYTNTNDVGYIYIGVGEQLYVVQYLCRKGGEICHLNLMDYIHAVPESLVSLVEGSNTDNSNKISGNITSDLSTNPMCLIDNIYVNFSADLSGEDINIVLYLPYDTIGSSKNMDISWKVFSDNSTGNLYGKLVSVGVTDITSIKAGDFNSINIFLIDNSNMSMYECELTITKDNYGYFVTKKIA